MEIKIESRSLGDVAVIVPDIFQDSRGFFMETFREDQFKRIGTAHAISCKTIIPARLAAWCVDCIFSGSRPWAN